MYNPATANYLRGGNARDFRRQMGQGMTNEDFERDQDWRADQMAQMARQQRTLAARERLAGIQSQTELGVADKELQGVLGSAETQADAARDVATTQAGAQTGVAEINAGAAQNVAGINAKAQKQQAMMNMLGMVSQSVGGVVGNWLQQGVERLRQEGQNDRLERMLGMNQPDKEGRAQLPDGAVMGGDGSVTFAPQDQQRVQPGAYTIRDPETNLPVAREFIGRDGKSKVTPLTELDLRMMDQTSKAEEKPGFFGRMFGGGNDAQPQTTATRGAQTLPGMQPVKGEPGAFTWAGPDGNVRQVRATPDGLMIQDPQTKEWSRIVEG